MSFTFDHLLLARILFTVMTAGYAVATVIADFNATHATNPKWTPHARFHVVWQITSYVGFGLFALVLIWWPGPLAVERLYLVGDHGRDRLRRLLHRDRRHAAVRRPRLRRQRLPALRGAAAALRQALGRQHHGVQRATFHLGGRTDGDARRLKKTRADRNGCSPHDPPGRQRRRPRYSTNTSSRRLRISGSMANASITAATISSPAEIGRVTKTLGSPRDEQQRAAQVLFHHRPEDEAEQQRRRLAVELDAAQ